MASPAGPRAGGAAAQAGVVYRVKSRVEVSPPPAKAVMIFDGDCNFCSLCVRRWQHTTDGHLEYLPFQDPAVAARFPEVPRREFETAVQLVETNGSVYAGAEAIFRALAHNPHKGRLLDWYLRSPIFARTSEWGYALVARHRTLFSRLTRLACSSHS